MAPGKLILLTTIEDPTGRLEVELHDRFSIFRIDGKKEWYHPSTKLMDYINNIGKEDCHE
jgi:hypothetical protein